MRLPAAADGRVLGGGGPPPRHHLPHPHLPTPRLRHHEHHEDGAGVRLGESL